MKLVKNVFFWALSIFLLLISIVYMPSFGSFLLILAAIMLAPITIIQNILNNLSRMIFKKKKRPRVMKGLVITLIAFIGIIAGAATLEPVETPDNNEVLLEQEIVEPSKDIFNEENHSIEEYPVKKEPINDEETEPEAVEVPVIADNPEDEDEPTEVEKPVEEPTEEPVENSSFEVHFIDVGQADAALVLCDGKAMLIDGGNAGDSSLIYSYLNKLNVSHLDYIVATHAHEDHIGGLSGALNYATVGTAYCSVDNYDSETFGDFVKYLDKQGKKITIPNVGDSFKLGSASVEIVGVNSSSTDHNDTSIVLRIVYGNTSFLFTGDAEREAEQTILSSGYALNSTVLKVGHHGSENSTSYVFLREVAPQYAVISVGNDNSYGHPTEEALSRLRDADVKTYRTDLQGTIVCVSDGSNVSFTVSKNADADTLAPTTNYETHQEEQTPTPTPEPEEVPVGTDYVGNKNSKKFHYAWCNSVDKMKESNKFYYTGTRDEMIAKGYDPCKNCNP